MTQRYIVLLTLAALASAPVAHGMNQQDAAPNNDSEKKKPAETAYQTQGGSTPPSGNSNNDNSNVQRGVNNSNNQQDQTQKASAQKPQPYDLGSFYNDSWKRTFIAHTTRLASIFAPGCIACGVTYALSSYGFNDPYNITPYATQGAGICGSIFSAWLNYNDNSRLLIEKTEFNDSNNDIRDKCGINCADQVSRRIQNGNIRNQAFSASIYNRKLGYGFQWGDRVYNTIHNAINKG